MWLILFSSIATLAIVSFGPTPRIWQRRIIIFRAAMLTVPEMWTAAWDRGHNIFPEMLRRTKNDI